MVTDEFEAVTHRGRNGGGRGWVDACKLHQLPGLPIILGRLLNVLVISHDAFGQVGQFTERVTHHGVAPAVQVFQVLG